MVATLCCSHQQHLANSSRSKLAQLTLATNPLQRMPSIDAATPRHSGAWQTVRRLLLLLQRLLRQHPTAVQGVGAVAPSEHPLDLCSLHLRRPRSQQPNASARQWPAPCSLAKRGPRPPSRLLLVAAALGTSMIHKHSFTKHSCYSCYSSKLSPLHRALPVSALQLRRCTRCQSPVTAASRSHRWHCHRRRRTLRSLSLCH